MNRLLLDTHVAIWLVNDLLPRDARETVIGAAENGNALISTATAWEIGLLAKPRGSRGPQVEFLPTPQAWFDRLLARANLTETPLTAEILIAASQLPGLGHGDPADRMLIATARNLNCPLMTRDRKILAYAEQGHVKAIPC